MHGVDCSGCDSYSDVLTPAWLLRQPRMQPSKPSCIRGDGLRPQPASLQSKLGGGKFHSPCISGHPCDVHVHAVCEANPSFAWMPDGTFKMKLPGLDVKVTTRCSPSPEQVRGVKTFNPQLDCHLKVPDLRMVVDPHQGNAVSSFMLASEPTNFMLLEVEKENLLSVTLSTDAPRGLFAIEDDMAGCRAMAVGERVLNYEIVPNGQPSFKRAGRYLQVHVAFAFELKLWLSGSTCGRMSRELGSDLHEALRPSALAQSGILHGADSSKTSGIAAQNLDETSMRGCPSTALDSTSSTVSTACLSAPGSDFSIGEDDTVHSRDQHSIGQDRSVTANHLACPTSLAEWMSRSDESMRQNCCLSEFAGKILSRLSVIDEQLTEIEHDVADSTLALQGGVKAVEVSRMRHSLSQLESKAKQLEMDIDDIHTAELDTGRQQAKDRKKKLLCRLEELFAQINATFDILEAKLGVQSAIVQPV